MERKLTFRIFRHTPQVPESLPTLDTFLLEETPGMTLFVALSKIRDELDPSLNLDFVCRAGVCGSCGMLINGRPGLACRTLTSSLPSTISLFPLPGFELVSDLIVDTGKWMRSLTERLEAWVHLESVPNVDLLEARMEPDLAEEIYELDRCIECGCCISACGSAQINENFIGAVGALKMARFRLDPKDTRSDLDYYKKIGNDNGVFGCMTLLGCHDVCPKQLPLQTQIAFLRRSMAKR